MSLAQRDQNGTTGHKNSPLAALNQMVLSEPSLAFHSPDDSLPSISSGPKPLSGQQRDPFAAMISRFCLFGACAGVLFATSCLAQDEIPLPNTPPPLAGTAHAIEEANSWSVDISLPKVLWKVIGQEDPKRDWPQMEVTVEEVRLTLPMTYSEASQLAPDSQNRIVNLAGERLTQADALKRLGARAPVLISVSGEMPAAYYLQTSRPDTLIVILGIPTAPASDLLPQAAPKESAQ